MYYTCVCILYPIYIRIGTNDGDRVLLIQSLAVRGRPRQHVGQSLNIFLVISFSTKTRAGARARRKSESTVGRFGGRFPRAHSYTVTTRLGAAYEVPGARAAVFQHLVPSDAGQISGTQRVGYLSGIYQVNTG